MLQVGLIGDGSLAEEALTRLCEDAATPVHQGEPPVWDAAQPGIWVSHHHLDEVPQRLPAMQLVLGLLKDDDERHAQVRLRSDALLEGPTTERLLEDLGAIWSGRVVPFEENLRAGRRAARRQVAILRDHDESWPSQASRLIERLARCVGRHVIRIDHVGSTSVPGLAAKDLLDIQVVVESSEIATEVANNARPAGLVHVEGEWFGTSRDGIEVPEEVVVDADPGRPANVNIRPAADPVWRDTLLLRDWLRAMPDERLAYESLKRDLAARPGQDVDAYGAAKLPWIASALRRADVWSEETKWDPAGATLQG